MRSIPRDPRLEAHLGPRTPLRYSAGPDDALDRSAHVRAGSALVLVGGDLVVVQDDAAFLAHLDPGVARVEALALPAGPGGRRLFDKGRGNKMDKLDLESAIPLGEDGLLAFGSGSAAGRDRILQATGLGGGNPSVALCNAGPLYQALAENVAFSGVGLNIEGAARVGPDTLRLFQRGNGAPVGDRMPVNASCDLSLRALLAWLEDPMSPLPILTSVVQYDLGAAEGVALGFTDAAAVPGGVLYLAAAEDTPNAVDDGPVVGVAMGLLWGEGGCWTLLREADGSPVLDKAEGLCMDPADPARGWVVFDLDDPDRPTELAPLRLWGPWPHLG